MCMVDGCDEFYASYNKPAPRKAAKEHRCTECGRAIAKGETYYASSGLMSGEGWDAHKTCAHCWVACEWLTANCGGFLHHGVHEDINEHANEYNRADLYRLSQLMRRKWKVAGRLRSLPALPRPLAEGDAAAPITFAPPPR